MSASQEQETQQFMPAMRIVEQPVNTAGPGPFYVYSPGWTFTALKNMVYLFNTIPAGRIFPITSGEIWTNGDHLPEGMAKNKRDIYNIFGAKVDKHLSREQPAQDTLFALISDRSLTQMGLMQVSLFDKNVDVQQDMLNLLIHPENIADNTWPKDKKLRSLIEQEGMLKLRHIWLEQAAEGLETGRMLEDVLKVCAAKPYLIEIWKEAIVDTLIPANDRFVSVANTLLAAVEDRIRAKKQLEYDPFANTLMWLLGRKPERTALSRTLEGTSKAGGLSLDDVKSLVEMMMKSNVVTSPLQAQEFYPCPDCGNQCEMVHGGPPRICWRCKYEFRSISMIELPPIPASTQSTGIEETTQLRDPLPEDEIERLAREMMEK